MRMYRVIFMVIMAAVFSFTVQAQVRGSIVRLDPALDDIVPMDAKIEKLADDFTMLEGPVWVRKGGYLLFSEIPANVIKKWNSADGMVSVFLEHSGFTGSDPSGVGGKHPEGKNVYYLIGSNGITLDRQGRVVYGAEGDRQVVRLEKNGRRTVLASRYQGKRLSSPNDLIYKSDGSLYFTDSTTGLREGIDDPKKELPFNGVYLFKGGKLLLLTKDYPKPNGLAFSPGEKYLYVNDTTKKNITRFDVLSDDSLANGRILVDMSADKASGAPDGMKVDQRGNIYCTGPGGVWIISPEGKHLGTLVNAELPANLAFGDVDGKSLYLTARTGLYRIRLEVPGILP